MEEWHTHCDETSTAKPNKYTGVGALFVNRSKCAEVCRSVLAWREKTGLCAELKWNKVSAKCAEAYRCLIEERIVDMTKGKMSFWCLFVNRSDFRHKQLASGCEDITYSKLYYQLIKHRHVRLLSRGDTVRIFPDDKDPPVDYSKLHSSIDYMMRIHLDQLPPVVTEVRALCSKKTHFGQINDILLGAASWHVNQRHLRKDASEAKTWLANEIAKMVSLPDLAFDTRRERLDFGVWRFEYNSAKKVGQTKPIRKGEILELARPYHKLGNSVSLNPKEL